MCIEFQETVIKCCEAKFGPRKTHFRLSNQSTNTLNNIILVIKMATKLHTSRYFGNGIEMPSFKLA